MNKSNIVKLIGAAAVTLAMQMMPHAARAETQSKTTKIVRVRVMPDGEAHLLIAAPLGGTCGSYLRLGGVGTDQVVRVATAALLSDRDVLVVYSDQINGNFCDLEQLILL